MKATAKIQTITTGRIVKTGEEFLEATVDIVEGEQVVETRKLGYPLGTTAKEIKADLKKMLKTREAELEQRSTQEERDEVDAKSQRTINALEGVEIKN